MSSDNDCDYKEMLANLQEKIKNFENPEGIVIDVNINPNCRDDVYRRMKTMSHKEIISLFESCGNMINSNHDFGKIDEKKVKSQLNKMKKMESNIKKKINDELEAE
jgi:hypothetical protein